MLLTYAGHRVDAPGSATRRFPAEDVPVVTERVRHALRTLRPRAVVGAAAAGGDLIVLRTALELGAQVHLVLPYPVDVFRARSVADLGQDWARAYDRVLTQVPAGQVRVLDVAGQDENAYEQANLAIVEQAHALAAAAAGPDGRPEPIVALVVRRRPSGGPPSLTDHFAALAQRRGLPLVDVDSAA